VIKSKDVIQQACTSKAKMQELKSEKLTIVKFLRDENFRNMLYGLDMT